MAQQKNQWKILMVLCHCSKVNLTLLLILVIMKTLQNFGAIVASLLFGKMIMCGHKKCIIRCNHFECRELPSGTALHVIYYKFHTLYSIMACIVISPRGKTDGHKFMQAQYSLTILSMIDS